MKAWKHNGGFTILEAMITLFVSATMLVSMTLLLGGKQQEVQFSQGIRSLESRFLDISNDTAVGYFPQNNNSTCTAGAGPGGGPEVSTGGTNEQGTNQGCVFLGRAIHLQEDRMVVYPIAGNRADADAAGATAGFSSARPVIVTSLEEVIYYPYGIELRSIHSDNSSTNRATDGALIVYASSPNGTGQAVGGGLNPGIQKITTYNSGNPASTSIGFGATTSSLTTVIQNAALSWPSGGYLVLCFDDSPTGSNRNVRGIVLSGGMREISSSIQLDGMGYQCV